MRSLAVLPLLAVPITALGHSGTRREVAGDPSKRYIFAFPNARQEALTQIKEYMVAHGFEDCLVIGGSCAENFQMYEVEK